jgi:hypothetical protein
MTGQEMTGMILRVLLVEDCAAPGGMDSSAPQAESGGGVRRRRRGGECFAISRRARR